MRPSSRKLFDGTNSQVVRQPGKCSAPEGYWQGKVQHPFAIANAMPPPLTGEAFGLAAVGKAPLQGELAAPAA